jgi:hypothetical protein
MEYILVYVNLWIAATFRDIVSRFDPPSLLSGDRTQLTRVSFANPYLIGERSLACRRFAVADFKSYLSILAACCMMPQYVEITL